IGQPFCGELKSVKVVSSGPTMLMIAQFSKEELVMGRTYKPILQLRGYRIAYRFVSDFAPIPASMTKHHIPGTGKSQKYIPILPTSYYLPAGRKCSFIFQGIHNRNTLECIRIAFSQLNLPESTSSGECQDGHLTVFGNRDLSSLSTGNGTGPQLLKYLHKLTEAEANMLQNTFKSNTRALRSDEGTKLQFCKSSELNQLLNIGDGNILNSPLYSDRSYYVLQFDASNMKSRQSIPVDFKLNYAFIQGELAGSAKLTRNQIRCLIERKISMLERGKCSSDQLI
ncbi:hypothetical protein Ciccas_013525, partial [Cichlidogyrus casuarinus]